MEQSKGGKKLKRASRKATHNKLMRAIHVRRARIKHVIRARRSCGASFARQLEEYYQQHLEPGAKVMRSRR